MSALQAVDIWLVPQRSLTRPLLQCLFGQSHPDGGVLEVRRGAAGKPEAVGQPSFQFNVSHSNGLSILAVSCGDVGIDVEELVHHADCEDVAAEVFPLGLLHQLRAAPVADRDRVFCELWCRHEAVMKLTGTGITGANHWPDGIVVNTVDVGPGRVAALATYRAPAVSVHSVAETLMKLGARRTEVA